MKALLFEGPETLRVVERPKPVPKPGEALIKVRACGICGSDVHGYFGLTGRRIPPMVMGHEFTGEVEAFGEGDQLGFNPGDRVSVHPLCFCGQCEYCKSGFTNVCSDQRFMGTLNVDGAMQEYVCVPVKSLFRLPENVSFVNGALIETLSVSYSGVKKAGDLTGKNVLIVGGGAIGQLALMVVKTKNPRTVILSDLSNTRLQQARALGADHVINPADKDILAEVKNLLAGDLVDVSIEAAGVTPSIKQAIETLKPLGTSIWIGNSSRAVEVNIQAVVTRQLQIQGSSIYTYEVFGETLRFMAKQKLDYSALITETISLERAPEFFAILHAETEKYLKVVITF